ncbi:MAG: phage head closure protein [Bacillota bacterium]
MKIGYLKHRIVLQKKMIAEDVLKQQTENWTDFAYVWASIEPLSGREYFTAQQINSEVSVRITIRYLPGLTAEARAVFDGRVFEVLSVVNPEERCESLILMCREAPV